MAVRRRNVNIAKSASKMIGALASEGVAAAYSDAVRVDMPGCTLLYLSGQTPIDDEGKLVGRTMADQTRQVLERLKRIIEQEGGRMTDIVRVRVFCTDISAESLRQIHRVRNEYFPAGAKPASTLIKISGIIRRGGKIEIDADAVIVKKPTRRRARKTR